MKKQGAGDAPRGEEEDDDQRGDDERGAVGEEARCEEHLFELADLARGVLLRACENEG